LVLLLPSGADDRVELGKRFVWDALAVVGVGDPEELILAARASGVRQ